MYVDATTLDAAATYRLLVGSVVPRPIAWVTSGVRPGPVNLAPFSSFTWVSQYPAMLGMTVNLRNGERKDTARNIRTFGSYVVNIADETLIEQVHASSEGVPAERGEAEMLGLELAESTYVPVPRLASAAVAMECLYDRTITFSPEGGEFIVGRVVGWHIDERVMDGARIDTALLQPLGRAAGPRYFVGADLVELAPVPGG